MPFLSLPHHGFRYRESKRWRSDRLAIIKLMEAIIAVPGCDPMKMRMLNHAIWLVAERSGNFRARFRSAEVVKGGGEAIQRDHVHQRKGLVKCLIDGAMSCEEVVDRAFVCVITKDEHKRLSKLGDQIDGFERYKQAQIECHDMSEERWPEG